MLFDSHAHFNEDSFTEEERQAIIAETFSDDTISYVVDIGYDLPSSVQAVCDAESHVRIYAAVGIHPHDSGSMTEDILDELRKLAQHDKVKAVGEIGLDYHYMRSEKEAQRYWFRRQIRLANDLGMPIDVHSREADRETMDILTEEGAFSAERKSMFQPQNAKGSSWQSAGVDIHCFSGSAELAMEYVSLGATIGICGPLTYKNNKKTVRVAESVPLECIMIETDTPFLAPEPMRGRPNRPRYVEYTARRLAEIKGITYAEAAERTCKNAERFYGIGAHI